MKNNKIIFTNGTINGMDAFADTIKCAMEAYYGDDVKVEVQDVHKNNGVILKGLNIVNKNCNTSPTIYLEHYYADYKAGSTLAEICKEIIKINEEHTLKCDFDLTLITDFNNAKDNVCFKVINTEKNEELLTTTPHKIFLDLAVVFFIEVIQEEDSKGIILIKNNLMDMWDGIDTDTLYKIALENTQRKYRGRVSSMFETLTEIMDGEFSEQFFDLNVEKDIPMYVATNTQKTLGAGVVMYDGLLRTFAKRIGDDFYILPSSTHEVLFVPASSGMDLDYLKQMVQQVNATEISEQEFLSNNVYYYSVDEDQMVIV